MVRLVVGHRLEQRQGPLGVGHGVERHHEAVFQPAGRSLRCSRRLFTNSASFSWMWAVSRSIQLHRSMVAGVEKIGPAKPFLTSVGRLPL